MNLIKETTEKELYSVVLFIDVLKNLEISQESSVAEASMFLEEPFSRSLLQIHLFNKYN